MAEYRTPYYTGQIYHLMNQGIDRRPTFVEDADYRRFIETLRFYNHCQRPMRFSYFNRLNVAEKSSAMQQLSNQTHVDILAFCLMPNHYHLLVKQRVEDGVPTLMSLLQNSYTRYFNTKAERRSCLFLDRFKVVPVVSLSQLQLVSRYIHFNPLESGIVHNYAELSRYPYSSLMEYADSAPHADGSVAATKLILESFSSQRAYMRYVFDKKRSVGHTDAS